MQRLGCQGFTVKRHNLFGAGRWPQPLKLRYFRKIGALTCQIDTRQKVILPVLKHHMEYMIGMRTSFLKVARLARTRLLMLQRRPMSERTKKQSGRVKANAFSRQIGGEGNGNGWSR